MIIVRKGHERGYFDHGWLKTYHTFSFAGYRDPQQVGFRALRVINEDRVEPGMGFDVHEHHDMEIISYVLSGALEHRDSLDNVLVLHAGQFQRLTAGTGLAHSEFNPSPSEPVHFLQIWIRPARRGLTPSYEQRAFPVDSRPAELALIASPDGRQGSLTVHQDVSLYRGWLNSSATLAHEFAPGRFGWVQVVRGAVRLGDVQLQAGDGAAISDLHGVELAAIEQPAEVLLFDLA
jgi:redox-sensitive bicupin YhaK (pirin superfamily)